MPPAVLRPRYDALLIIGFGGPERPEDVAPFLENVTRGRGIPKDRLEEVAAHYHHFGGKSPLNDQVRDLIAAIVPELAALDVDVPIYWGNRNWHPFLPSTVQQMKEDGIENAIALALSAFPLTAAAGNIETTSIPHAPPQARRLPAFTSSALFAESSGS